jgi:hypothetical protein
MAIICLELIGLALIVSNVFTIATIGMMTSRIEQLEEDVEQLQKDSQFNILARARMKRDIDKLNENNRIEVENDGWN